MILFSDKRHCCGCGACMNICPQNAISMEEDEYGFIYPHIDESRCVDCELCIKVCQYQTEVETNAPLSVFAAVNKNKKRLMLSASGGIFAASAEKVIADGGVVFGAALENTDSHFVSHHICVAYRSELVKLQGSKYVQSSIEHTYKEAKDALKEGKRVLFSGTPCQIAGLKTYLGKNYDRLILIDLICHGVPNERFFNDYIHSKFNKLRNSIQNFVFRDKARGWGMTARLDYRIRKANIKSLLIPARISSYFSLFLDGYTYRESCYNCKYACAERPGDLTIGDYWGIEKEHPELLKKKAYDEQNGISCILANTKKGMAFIKELNAYIHTDSSAFEKVIRRNGQLKAPSVLTPRREKIMMLYRNGGYTAVEKFFRKHYKKQIVVHIIYNAIPRKLRLVLKRLLIKG